MRWSERPPAAGSRFAYLGPVHFERRALSVAVAHLILVRCYTMRFPRECLIFLATLMLVIAARLVAEEKDDPAVPGILHYESIGLPHGELITYDFEGDSLVK